ncbi:signal recognition particle-docking protein FtsY [Trueperella pecoris]|uniref:Signal recognition particle receptor FtsY n=1 Tax=Trueperella pecoris TaxID=2733571 RepID=A0A7M1QWZ4_9ACTO|nr:signal recognition particle-docking protein FtsY [Trueperella pecoris]
MIILIAVIAVLIGAGVAVGLRRRSSSAEISWDKREQIEAGEPEAGESEAGQAETPAGGVAQPGAAQPSVPEISDTELPGLESAPADPDSTLDTSVEVPEAVGSRMERLRGRLANSGVLGRTLLSILSRGDLSEADWEELEDTLLMADVGLDATTELMDTLRTQTKVRGTTDPEEVRAILREELIRLVGPDADRSLNLEPSIDEEGTRHPASLLMVGVNGTGKTTTTGKLARLLVAEGKSVVLGAADTFRAAAADQLSTWGERVGVDVVRSDREGADPASVAFEAVKIAREAGTDVVIVDTAGRLQNKAGLMDELGKIKRVMEKGAPLAEVLLVLDATTGQNGMSQAKVFAEVAGITGIVLTKLDGTAKGGIVISVQRELGVPVKFVGLGEGADDFAPFSPQDFVDSLLS